MKALKGCAASCVSQTAVICVAGRQCLRDDLCVLLPIALPPSKDPRAHRGSTCPAGTLAPQHQEAWAAPALILSHWTWGVFAAVIVKTFCL